MVWEIVINFITSAVIFKFTNHIKKVITKIKLNRQNRFLKPGKGINMNEKWIINTIFLLKVFTIIFALFATLKIRKILIEKNPKHIEVYSFLIQMFYMICVMMVFFLDEIVDQKGIPSVYIIMVVGNLIIAVVTFIIDYVIKKKKKNV